MGVGLVSVAASEGTGCGVKNIEFKGFDGSCLFGNVEKGAVDFPGSLVW